MKTKTARIVGYHVFGTKTTCAVDVLYRGRVLRGSLGRRSEETALRTAAENWAKQQGFTHVVHVVN